MDIPRIIVRKLDFHEILVLWWTITVALVIVAVIWTTDLERSKAVCHSVTEDSVITDCSYENGEWHKK